ncbi:MAG TPA: TlpA disulfide reductase family protein [Roseiarcus sp.]|nr:TlpA disulfide reductase family protein [Roseiarcus sp.]
MTGEKTGTRRNAPLLAMAAIVVVVAAGLAVLYGKGAPGKDEAAACPKAKATAERLAPLAHGALAALAVDRAPALAVDISFNAPDGKKLSLADFRGRNILLNLWATWCVPCRSEMPALDKLEAKFGGPDFEVVAVNIDTNRLDRPKAFLTETGVKNLSFYADPSADAFESLRVAGKALGLPTSLFIDKDGCEIGVMAGPAAWDSGEAEGAVAALLGRERGS